MKGIKLIYIITGTKIEKIDRWREKEKERNKEVMKEIRKLSKKLGFLKQTKVNFTGFKLRLSYNNSCVVDRCNDCKCIARIKEFRY